MKATDLVAVHAITRKPGGKLERIAPGESFSPKDDAERAEMLRLKAARAPLEKEITSKGSKKAPAKKADPAPAEKPVVMDAEPGDTGSDSGEDMLG